MVAAYMKYNFHKCIVIFFVLFKTDVDLFTLSVGCFCHTDLATMAKSLRLRTGQKFQALTDFFQFFNCHQSHSRRQNKKCRRLINMF